MSRLSVNNVALVLCLVYAAASALPQDLTTSAENVTTVAPVPSYRQARADFSSLARFVTPDNMATMKSLFTGLGNFGSTGLSNILTFNLSNLVIIVLLAGLAILIAPAVLSLFGLGTLGALGPTFGRSLGLDGKNPVENAERVYRALDGFFQSYNIDAKICLQRFACTASRSSASAVRQGNPSYMDSALNYVINSSYGNTILDKTSLLDAVTFGQSGGDCEIEYGKCPFSWDKVSQYVPFNLFGASTTPQTPIQPLQSNYKQQ